jgi:hypothetical protein
MAGSTADDGVVDGEGRQCGPRVESNWSLIVPVAKALLRAARLVWTAAVMAAASRHHGR